MQSLVFDIGCKEYDINGDNQVTADDIIALVNFIAKGYDDE